MCTFCGQHCVEDDAFRLSPKEIKSGTRVAENICPDKCDHPVEFWETFDDNCIRCNALLLYHFLLTNNRR